MDDTKTPLEMRDIEDALLGNAVFGDTHSR